MTSYNPDIRFREGEVDMDKHHGSYIKLTDRQREYLEYVTGSFLDKHNRQNEFGIKIFFTVDKYYYRGYWKGDFIRRISMKGIDEGFQQSMVITRGEKSEYTEIAHSLIGA